MIAIMYACPNGFREDIDSIAMQDTCVKGDDLSLITAMVVT
jgi:hypothetical protein